MRLRFRMVPSDQRFFALFNQSTMNVSECARTLRDMVNEFEDDLEGYETSKGTIRFQPERPLPASLVRRIVKARVAQNAATKSKATKSKAKQAKSKQATARGRGGRATRAD